MIRTFLVFFLSLGFFHSCSGVRVITPGDRASLYTESFLNKIEQVKQLYAQGEIDQALLKLRGMPQESLLPTEEALKRNLIGVIQFSMGNYQQAIFQFDGALSNSRLDPELTAQIHLNLASTYFKLDQFERAFTAITRSLPEHLAEEEAIKHHRLLYTLSRELGRDREAAIALIRLLGTREKISEIRSDVYFSELMTHFFALNRREKLRIIEMFKEDLNLAAGLLAFLEAERIYYSGNKSESLDILNWLERRFARQDELIQMVRNFVYRLENFTQMDQRAIGIVVPLSGERRALGERLLLGIDFALQELAQELGQKPFDLYIMDGQDGPAIGAYRVNELIEQHNVALIIGGTTPEEAEKQYRQARQKGVFYISLSQIPIPRVEKNHLLLELPGSLESQIARLFREDMLETFGRRAAIVYPETPLGEAYVHEFWAQAALNQVSVNGVTSYPEGLNDFRDPIRLLLGLSHPRNRAEEAELLEEIHSLERRRGVRRVNTLRPQFDFDWVFIPSGPVEALQIIPNFNYFDAHNLKIVGVPSWRSRAMLRESNRLGEIFFIGDDLRPIDPIFAEKFSALYQRSPALVEVRGRDAMGIAAYLLKDKDFPNRDDFDIHLRQLSSLEGLTGSWAMSENIWIKDMPPLRMRRGQMRAVFQGVSDLNRYQDEVAPQADEASEEESYAQ